MSRSRDNYLILVPFFLFVCCFTTSSLEATVVRIAFVVGNDIGDSHDVPLQFAQSDARRIGEILADLGRVEKSRIHLLLGKDKSLFDNTLEQIKGRVAEIIARGDEAMLLFYFSGHGSKRHLHLGNTLIELTALREELKATKAAIVIGIIDACHSGGIGLSKGGHPDQAFDITIYDESTPRGMVLISSSLADELAQESLEIGGSLFTHYFISALRGEADYDMDGHITLQEAYTSAYHHTLGTSVTTSIRRQHPLADIDLTGKGEVVLTYLKKSSASIFFPPETSGRYMVIQNLKNRVMAEVSKDKGRNIRLALPPGDYKIYKQEKNNYLVTDLNLIWGGEHIVIEADMEKIPYQLFARKSSGLKMRKNKALIQSEILEAELPGMSSSAAYGLGYERLLLSRLSLGFTVSWSQQHFNPEDIPLSRVQHQVLRIGLLLDYHFSGPSTLPFLAPYIGLFGEYVSGSDKQDFEYKPDLEITKHYQSIGFGPEIGLTIKLPDRWSASICAREVVAWTNIPYEDRSWEDEYGEIISTDTHQNLLLWHVCLALGYEF
ncbi:caspase domain-containing protein [candidate division CSSED10-310 bacterium]|uniref:Caspase domain-containing protein n=1 Tax=candidate division CSSED10-310 bacterium TaxID=2855610 RepID=A0ABV6YS38_UNCC1